MNRRKVRAEVEVGGRRTVGQIVFGGGFRSGRKGESALQAGERLSEKGTGPFCSERSIRITATTRGPVPFSDSQIAGRYNERLHCLADAGRGELKGIAAAVGETAYCQIMAGIELGRRVAMSLARNSKRLTRITDSDDALQFCRDRLPGRQVMRPRRNFTSLPWMSSFRSSARI